MIWIFREVYIYISQKLGYFMKPAAMLHATGCNDQRNRLRWMMEPIAFNIFFNLEFEVLI